MYAGHTSTNYASDAGARNGILRPVANDFILRIR